MADYDHAATLLWNAGRGVPLARLPAADAPRTFSDAMAIQDRLIQLSNQIPTAWKVFPNGGDVHRGAILPSRVISAGGTLPRSALGRCGIEAEIAFRFTQTLAPQAQNFTRDDIANAIEPLLVIEIVASRYTVYDNASVLERLADFMSNGGLVVGPVWKGWHEADQTQLRVTVEFDGEQVADVTGGHGMKDSILPLIEFVNATSGAIPFTAGTIVTTGAIAGCVWTTDARHVRAIFHGAGEVGFTITD
jgi:2-keto-4-pentenoate hydratase